MLKRLLVGVSFLMLGAFGLQAQSSSTQSNSSSSQQQYGSQSGSQPDTQGQYGTQSSSTQQSGSLSKSDQDFLKKAYQSNLSEIKLGQIAQQRASNNDVKQYAQQLVNDHQKANDQLQQIASSKGVSLPSSAPSAESSRFSNLSGSNFDREFIQHQMRAHKQAIPMFQKEANSSKDPDLKSFASDQLSALRQHEQMANDLHSRFAPSRQARTSEPSSSSSSYSGSSSGQSSGQYGSESSRNDMNMPSDSSSSSQSSSSTSTSTTTNNYQAGDNQNLPRTASNMPLIGLFGFMLLGAALIMRSLRLLRKNR